MVDLNGHEAGNSGYSQGKPTAYRDSSTRRDAYLQTSDKRTTEENADSLPREGFAVVKVAAFRFRIRNEYID